MKLADVRSAYEALSGKTSEIVRQLSLAGVGLIWALKATGSQSVSVDPELVKAALFIALSLLFDFVQYVLGTTVWFLYFRHKEKEETKEADEFLAPAQINWPLWIFFYAKSAMMLIAYLCYIVPFLAKKFGV
jgi:hypothetical protein